MKRMTVTARELFYMAARLGGTAFYGLPDPFLGMDRERLREELFSLRLSLAVKRLASFGDDSSFHIEPDAAALAETCALCERWLWAGSAGGGRRDAVRWYRRGERIVELRPEGPDLLLRSVTAARLRKELAGLAGPDPCAPPAAQVVVRQGELLAARREPDDEKALALLEAAGCGGAAGRILLEGLRGRAAFTGAAAVEPESGASEACFFVRGGEGRLALRRTAGGWRVEGADRAAAQETLSAVAVAFLGGAAGEEADG